MLLHRNIALKSVEKFSEDMEEVQHVLIQIRLALVRMAVYVNRAVNSECAQCCNRSRTDEACGQWGGVRGQSRRRLQYGARQASDVSTLFRTQNPIGFQNLFIGQRSQVAIS